MMRSARLLGLVPLVAAALLGSSAPGARAQDAGPARGYSFTPLVGAGSWVPAIGRWSHEVRARGIVIDLTPDGAAAGQQSYVADLVDFAASGIPFVTTPEPFFGEVAKKLSFAFSYIPIVAEGTAFPYNLVVDGRKITNMRLSGATIVKIFTGQITNWDNKSITRDYGAQLPSIPITVAVPGGGSDASYQFTRWMSREYPAQWQRFCARSGGPKSHCGPTVLYPTTALPRSKSFSTEPALARYIASPSSLGAIGYDPYPLLYHVPVLEVRNPAGHYTLPTAPSVAAALADATINQDPGSIDFLIQNLDNVYTSKNPRSYPLSSYSYLIVARDRRTVGGVTYYALPGFTRAKGKTLTTWLRYALCAGQRAISSLGYSPLPASLIKGAFVQLGHVPGHISTPNAHQLNRCIKAT